LSFRYDARQASLVDLTDQKHPAHYDLCGVHADVLIVPKGWERLDRRSPAPDPKPAIEALVRVIDKPPAAPTRLNRYAALTAELPRLAEACGLTVPDGGEAPPSPRYRGQPDHTPRGHDGGAPATRLYEPVTDRMAPEKQVIEGQLQMPIEPEPEGVVVALMRTRQA
jgi:hypothetical protein